MERRLPDPATTESLIRRAVRDNAWWCDGHPGHGSHTSGGGLTWTRVTEPESLRSWEAAWGHAGAQPFFRPDLLRSPGVDVLGAWQGPDVVAGAVLTRGPDDVVGVSNLFTSRGDGRAAWAAVLAWTAAHHPGLALVGYEAGPDLDAAQDVGFRPLGPLRIWMADDAAGSDG